MKRKVIYAIVFFSAVLSVPYSQALGGDAHQALECIDCHATQPVGGSRSISGPEDVNKRAPRVTLMPGCLKS